MRARLFAILAVLACAVRADACDCPAPPPYRVSVTRSDAVFMGVVQTVRDSADIGVDGEVGPAARVAAIKVETSWKGVSADTVVYVWTGIGGGDCGFSFDPEHRYVVFTHGPRFRTGICDRTMVVRFEKAVMDSLGRPIDQTKKLIKKRATGS